MRPFLPYWLLLALLFAGEAGAVTEATVINGTITGSSSTTDFTKSGFGTPDVALIIGTYAGAASNPRAGQTATYGFYDGTTQYATSIRSLDNLDTTLTDRKIAEVAYSYGHGTYPEWTASYITDGVRLTHTSGATSLSFYVTVILFKGLLNEAIGSFNLGTSTSTKNVNLGFKADLVFLTTVDRFAPPQFSGGSLISFGAAHINSSDVVSEAAIYHASKDNVDTTVVNSLIADNYSVGRIYNDLIPWQASVGSYASGFSLTPSASASNHHVYYLALELADPDDAWVDLIQTATSTGNQATTGVGFQPDVLVFAGATLINKNTLSTTACAHSVGAADTDTDAGYSTTDEDDVDTTNAESFFSADYVVYNKFSDQTVDSYASLNSLDSDGFTLNYVDASTSARYLMAVAVGDSTAVAGPTAGTIFLDGGRWSVWESGDGSSYMTESSGRFELTTGANTILLDSGRLEHSP